MTDILDFIVQNYIWLLSGAILTLLAIIGSYADKTNFGQGEQKEEKENKLDSKILDLKINSNTKNEKPKKDTNKVEEQPIKEKIEKEEIKKVDSKTKYNQLKKSFDDFDKEFNEILPKKDLIDSDLLEDIDSFSLDKTQKFNFKDIPDLDDVDLPKIKKFKKQDSKEDIWNI